MRYLARSRSPDSDARQRFPNVRHPDDHPLNWFLPPMPAYCEVALPVPLERTFTYAIREGQRPQRGARVIAPFRKEKLIGIVTALNELAPPDFEVRNLEAVLDEDGEPLLSEHLMKLGEWIAQYYLAPLGEGLRSMLPLMAEVQRLVYYRITDLGRDVLARIVENEPDLASGAEDLLPPEDV